MAFSEPGPAARVTPCPLSCLRRRRPCAPCGRLAARDAVLRARVRRGTHGGRPSARPDVLLRQPLGGDGRCPGRRDDGNVLQLQSRARRPAHPARVGAGLARRHPGRPPACGRPGPSPASGRGRADARPAVDEAADACPRRHRRASPQGRPLYAAHAELPWPDEPHLVLWHAVTLLREYRGDGHVAALLGCRRDWPRRPHHAHRHRARLHRAGRESHPRLVRRRVGLRRGSGLRGRGRARRRRPHHRRVALRDTVETRDRRAGSGAVDHDRAGGDRPVDRTRPRACPAGWPPPARSRPTSSPATGA